MVLFLNNDEQANLIDSSEAVAVLKEGLREYGLGYGTRRPRTDTFVPTTRPGEFLSFSSMEGGLKHAGYYALRFYSNIISWPKVKGVGRRVTFNTKPGLSMGLVFLFKVEDASLVCIMNDGFVQHLRVAATAAIGAEYLSRQNSSVVAMIGSGGMARSFASSTCSVRNIERINVFSIHRDHAEEYSKEMSKALGCEVSVFDEPRKAVQGSDIICACTNSMEPVIKGEWVEPGSYLTCVKTSEFGQDVIDRVDTLGLLVDKRPMSVGTFFDEDFAVRVECLNFTAGSREERERIPSYKEQFNLGKAVYVNCVNWGTNEPYKRRSDGEITMLSGHTAGVRFSDAGASNGIQGIQFASIGGRIFENAKKKGFGRELPEEMFVQRFSA